MKIWRKLHAEVSNPSPSLLQPFTPNPNDTPRHSKGDHSDGSVIIWSHCWQESCRHEQRRSRHNKICLEVLIEAPSPSALPNTGQPVISHSLFFIPRLHIISWLWSASDLARRMGGSACFVVVWFWFGVLGVSRKIVESNDTRPAVALTFAALSYTSCFT